MTMTYARADPQSSGSPPDPERQVAVLIEGFGINVALELARDYSDRYPGSAYWTAVRQSIEQTYERQAAEGSRP